MVDDPTRDVVAAVVRRLGFLHDRLLVIAPDIDGITWTATSRGRRLEIATVRSSPEERRYVLDIDVDIDGSDAPAPVADAGTAAGGPFSVVMAAQGSSGHVVTFTSRRADAFTPVLQGEIAFMTRLVMTADVEASWPDLLGTGPGSRHERVTRELQDGTHSARVTQYSRMIAVALVGPLELAPEYVDAVCLYASLHDIGEIDVSDRILNKPGRLDPEQWDVIRDHPLRGRTMVDDLLAGPGGEDVAYPEVLRSIVELHHEALDGHGYPHGLRAESIPLEARIVTVADVFDALTHSRPYKPGWTVAQALEEMDRMAAVGTIDGRCLTALATQLDALESLVARDSS